jgi:hypothetical protein
LIRSYGTNFVDVDYKIEDSIPGANGSAFENRVHDAAAKWNAICCVAGFLYVDAGNDGHAWGNACGWEDAATDVLGLLS